MFYRANPKPMGIYVIISRETEAVTQGLNQRNNARAEEALRRSLCHTQKNTLHQE